MKEWVMMTDLVYNGNRLPAHLVQLLVKKARDLNVPPSFLIVLLHFEGTWGASNVARADNNWGGMTWTGDPLRPSGIKVSKGTARPANEGGNYMRYANVDDFLDDWAHLLRDGGIYKVAGAKTFDEAVKGMFKVGGAKYDYATMNVNSSQQRYEMYLDRMKARRKTINDANNGKLDRLDNLKGVDDGMTTAQQVLNEARKHLGVTMGSAGHANIVNRYNQHRPLARGTNMLHSWDWCAVFVSYVFIALGATNLSGTEMSVGFFRDNHFRPKGIWLGKTSSPRAGDIITWDWDGNGWPDHIGFVESVSGNTITTIEGNTIQGGVSKVGRNTFSKGDWRIYGYARPKYGTSATVSPTKSVAEIAKEVLQGKWGNGNDRITRLTNAGYNPTTVQNEVNKLVSTPAPKPTKTVAQVAKEVLQGKWGNGKERQDKLTKEGYNYKKIQDEVNKLLAPDLTKVARDVIAGKYGNDPVRSIKLRQQDYDPVRVQAMVNQLL